MKTIREWLNELTEPYRSRAIRNAVNTLNPLLDLSQVSMEDAIWGAFDWNKTPEGHDFWYSVSHGQTPELPEHLNEEE